MKRDDFLEINKKFTYSFKHNENIFLVKYEIAVLLLSFTRNTTKSKSHFDCVRMKNIIIKHSRRDTTKAQSLKRDKICVRTCVKLNL